MNKKVLFVDDDLNILSAYKRQLHKHFEVETVDSGESALKLISKQELFAVVVADMNMPGMNGVELLSKIRQETPETVRIMLTGQADISTAMDAVNEGHIYRFLTKPCPIETLAKSLTAGVEQFRLVTAEKELLEKTLRGSIKVLTDVLSLVNPTAFGRASRIRRLVSQIANELNLESSWQIEVAAMLSQLGCVIVPENTLEKLYKDLPLTADEKLMFEDHPKIGSELINNIPRLKSVADIIKYQEKNYDGSGIPSDNVNASDIPIGARILKTALDFDLLVMKGKDRANAWDLMRIRQGKYDPRIIESLKSVLDKEMQYIEQIVNVDDLMPVMILAEDIKTTSGLLLISKGQEVSVTLRERLKNYVKTNSIEENIKVLLPVSILKKID